MIVKIYDEIDYCGNKFVITGIHMESSAGGSRIIIYGMSPELANTIQVRLIEQDIIQNRLLENIRRALDDDQKG